MRMEVGKFLMEEGECELVSVGRARAELAGALLSGVVFHGLILFLIFSGCLRNSSKPSTFSIFRHP